jgi:uncharacterized protein (UPF0261 family)
MAVTKTADDVPRVALLVTLDTKAEIARFLSYEIIGCGCRPYVIDVGLRGPEEAGFADVTRADVARAAGTTLAGWDSLDKGAAMEVVATGVGRLLGDLAASGDITGVLGVGGGSGSWLTTRAVHDLPLGFPKMLVSTGTQFLSADMVSDIVLVPSITDIAGLNEILRGVLRNATRAICAMRPRPRVRSLDDGHSVAMTMFGVTTAGGDIVRDLLEDAGCSVAVFHANGAGGKTMERLIKDGAFDAVIDWTPTELVDELVGGSCSAGPDRLEAAGLMGLPQLVVPGAMDVINAGDPATLPERFQGRLSSLHRSDSLLVRTDATESYEVGVIMGRKLAMAKGPVRVVVPEGGFSALDAVGHEFADRAADAELVRGLHEQLPEAITVESAPGNINDRAFAEHCAKALLSMLAPT